MTISSTNRKAGPFTGNGITTAFPFSFKVFSAADVLVVQSISSVETVKILGTDYTVTLSADQNANPGGTVTALMAPPVGATLTVTSQLPNLQPTDLTNQGGFYPRVINDALDRLTIFVQQLAEKLGRTLRFPLSDGAVADMPGAAARANNLLGFDGNGNPVALAPAAQSATALQALLAASSGSSLLGFISSAAGASARTVYAWLNNWAAVKNFVAGDGVVDDTVGLTAAVAQAYGTGKPLYWNGETCKTNSSIPNLHLVKHVGRGTIVRGADAFRVNPAVSDTNTLYLGGAGGSSTNDGLSATDPFNTFQPAFNALANYGPVLDGSWSVVAAAGTYSILAGYHVLKDIQSRNRITIRGPVVAHPGVPTCIVDGGSVGADYTHGLAFVGDGLRLYVKYIKFQNFNGDPSGNSRGGLLFDEGCDAATDNVHVNNCSWFGVYYSRRTAGRHSGGIINACRNGINSDGAKLSVGYGAASLATGTTVTNCTESGIYWSRGTDGHVDYCNVENNAVGLLIDSSSRVDSVGSSYKLNTIGVRCVNGGRFGDNPYIPSLFYIGVAGANVQSAIEYKMHSGESGEGFDACDWVRVASDRILRTVTGTAPTVLATPYTIKAGRLQGSGKSCRVLVHGIYTATAGSVLTVKFGGMTLNLAVSVAATSVAFIFEVVLHDVSGGYRAFGSLLHSLASPRMGTASSGFINTADQAITVECAMVGAGDFVSIYRTDVYLIG